MNMTGNRPHLIIIVGPTGVGKTSLAIELAEVFGGEIINADSMQVYRYMNIGTAKPTPEDRSRIRHHLIDIVNPDEEFNAALFTKEAERVIKRLNSESKTIFVVGGTGLYVRALLGGLFEGPGADKKLRDSYKYHITRFGKEHLYELLENKDKIAAGKIHPNDTVRIIRALEVMESTGESIVKKQHEHGFRKRIYNYSIFGFSLERKLLYDRIDRRADRMMADGLMEEVKMLMEMGYDESLTPMRSMCYRHVIGHIKGKHDISEAIRLVKRDTRRYAKRQLTWFKKDKNISWYDPSDLYGIQEKIKTAQDRLRNCN
jgi:tRNA dimethylallyltransferase